MDLKGLLLRGRRGEGTSKGIRREERTQGEGKERGKGEKEKR